MSLNDADGIFLFNSLQYSRAVERVILKISSSSFASPYVYDCIMIHNSYLLHNPYSRSVICLPFSNKIKKLKDTLHTVEAAVYIKNVAFMERADANGIRK
jgi:hypothetical protein